MGYVKYSVIIPVWNGEKTIKRCLNSLLTQRREDVEILVIDDGSTDGSWELIQKYEKEYPCVSAIHQANRGVSAARNTGLKRCTGEYVLFVDCDDYVNRRYFEHLDELDDQDLWVFARIQEKTGRTDQQCLRKIACLDDFFDQLETLILERKMLAVWNKRFKTGLIRENHLHYREGYQIGEDALFCMDYAMCCHSIGISSKVLYCVDTGSHDSLSRTYRSELNLTLKNVYQRIEYQCLQERNLPGCTDGNNGLTFGEQKRLLSVLDYLYVRNLFGCIGEEFKTGNADFWENIHVYASICTSFNYVLGAEGCYVNWKHRMIRQMLARKQYYLIYAGSWGKVHIYERLREKTGRNRKQKTEERRCLKRRIAEGKKCTRQKAEIEKGTAKQKQEMNSEKREWKGNADGERSTADRLAEDR